MKGKCGIGIYTISDERCFAKQEDGTDSTPEYAADFETAVAATSFGRFNLILLLSCIPCSTSVIMDTNSLSYIIPTAECDLHLTPERKGIMNAVTYVGMISSAFISGFVADTFGRKRCLMISFSLDAFFVILCGFSQNFQMLIMSKFMTGFVINGVFAALLSLLSEFHSTKYRSTVILVNGIIHSAASIFLPLLGWLILTKDIEIVIFDGTIVFHSWNVYLFACSIPSIICVITFAYLPESPKFLTMTGKNDEALRILKKVYSINTGNHPDSYPIKTLIDDANINVQEKTTHKKTTVQLLKDGGRQLSVLFYPPHLSKITIIFIIQFGSMAGVNALRLWLPQFFSAIAHFKEHNNNQVASVCEMLKPITSSDDSAILHKENCDNHYDYSSTYTNNIAVSIVKVITYIAVTVLLSNASKKGVMTSMGLIAGICGISIYFVYSEAVIVGLAAIYISFATACLNIMGTIAIDLFPTNLRSTALSLMMMFGRFGSVLGNIVFQILVSTGCLPPFLVVGLLIIGTTLLSMTLPNTDNKCLE